MVGRMKKLWKQWIPYSKKISRTTYDMRATDSSALHQRVTFFDNLSFWRKKNEEIEWREEQADGSDSKSIEIGEIGEESDINGVQR